MLGKEVSSVGSHTTPVEQCLNLPEGIWRYISSFCSALFNYPGATEGKT